MGFMTYSMMYWPLIITKVLRINVVQMVYTPYYAIQMNLNVYSWGNCMILVLIDVEMFCNYT